MYRSNAQNKRGQKGSTGSGGRGFSTPDQADSGRRMPEDTPGLDFRTRGDRRFGKGTNLPGGQVAKTDHGIYRDSKGKPDGYKNRDLGMAGQKSASQIEKGKKRRSIQKAAQKRISGGK